MCVCPSFLDRPTDCMVGKKWLSVSQSVDPRKSTNFLSFFALFPTFFFDQEVAGAKITQIRAKRSMMVDDDDDDRDEVGNHFEP